MFMLCSEHLSANIVTSYPYNTSVKALSGHVMTSSNTYPYVEAVANDRPYSDSRFEVLPFSLSDRGTTWMDGLLYYGLVQVESEFRRLRRFMPNDLPDRF
jgi:hypothetical protein